MLSASVAWQQAVSEVKKQDDVDNKPHGRGDNDQPTVVNTQSRCSHQLHTQAHTDIVCTI